jgi:ACS family D-galactonate transporter-like MFS transporter
MTLTTVQNPRRLGIPLARILCLLAVSALFNYIDRGNLSIAAPLLKDELHISAAQLGMLIAAFFWTYTVLMPVGGWMVDRFNVNWVLTAGFVVWSLATAATGLVHGIYMLTACRVVLGAGESVAFPSCARILAQHVPQQHRGLANAMIIAGVSAGPALGTFGCGMLMARYGWRPVFIFLGLASLIWVLPWIRWMPKDTTAGPRVLRNVSIAAIFHQRAFWGAALGHFCSNYPLYLMIGWLPFYLVRERHYTMQTMAKEGALFYTVFAIVAPIAGWVADAIVRSGARPSIVRRATIGIGHSVIAAGVLGCGADDARLLFVSLMVLGAGYGLVGPNIYVFAQTLAGPPLAGKWTGLQNAFGNLAGVVVAPLTGFIVDRTGHFWWAFVVAAIVAALGAISWVVIVGPLKRVDFKKFENWPTCDTGSRSGGDQL